MKMSVEKLISFNDGKAEVNLPKNATDISIRIEDSRRIYFCALADSEQKKEEKYLVLSYDEEKKDADLIFLKKINHIVCGILYWYCKKC